MAILILHKFQHMIIIHCGHFQLPHLLQLLKCFPTLKLNYKIFKENDSRFYSIIKELSKIDKNLHVIQEINTISYHLLKQDEIDKKSMSLIELILKLDRVY